MKETEKYVKSRQLHKEDYSLESKVELDGKEKVHSISLTSDRKQNDENVYTSALLERILDKDNMNEAFKRVKKNKGSHGIDKLTVDELLTYLQEHGADLKESILEGKYIPQPVRRVEIPKDNGKKRQLGIPTVVDRVIQQAIAQVLSPIFEEIFSEYSYGFRPNRGCHDALKQCKTYINDGYRYAIDLDLEAYFDTVNHDKLIGLIYKQVKDVRVISLIRKYLQAGVMKDGVISKPPKGVPQGGNLSPLLSNIMLNELDVELETRGLRFVRYADDCNIYVKSLKAAHRVMASITKFIEGRLKLKVNQEKSKVGRPWKLKFLGYSFYCVKGGVDFRVHEKSIRKLKEKIKYLTGRSRIGNIKATYIKIKQVIVGWINYFKLAKMKDKMRQLDEWLRSRLRMCYWKQWKKIKTKYKNLRKLGIDEGKAWEFANTRKGYWRTAHSPILSKTITNAKLKKSGLVSLTEIYAQVC
ncbi:group II intron reverse transcriptase/maturase [Vallitalea guaymasensis]|uniref:Group II intron reverse transcriptase/maturase n=1 Tax=Vallitalea guaymasensis TaxID=1185412 RepID=A0A8J8MFC4_9FIRM|nr:group II intron reverse transcriptase/maturase [Vallitalea guaymasensis]QUH31952.1 group II intron reverse transcriptase/maturase [Vallitalea guaymasensis]